jgi:hypothetical protein
VNSREAKLGQDHPELENNLVYLADCYYSTGNYRAAEPVLRQLLRIREKQGPVVSDTRRTASTSSVPHASSTRSMSLMSSIGGSFSPIVSSCFLNGCRCEDSPPLEFLLPSGSTSFDVSVIALCVAVCSSF